MLAPGRSPLAGLVEVDETEIACRSKNDPVTGGGGRSHQGKILVVGAVEVEHSGLGPGRLRLSQVPDYSATSLHAFLAANVGTGATAKTDGWSGYPGAPGVTHDPHVVGKMAAHIVLPWVHRIFSNLVALGDRETLEVAAQAVETELNGTQPHPVAAAIDARAARFHPLLGGDREMDAAAEIDAVGPAVDLDQQRQRMGRERLRTSWCTSASSFWISPMSAPCAIGESEC